MVKKPLISSSSVFFSYGKNDVLEDISLEIKKEDFIALIGPNGSGKTTLVKILLGFLKPTKGSVKVSIPKNKIGYVPQRYSIDNNFPGTVEEILSAKNKHLIEQVGIKDLIKKKFISLSGGQRQKVLIALALEKNPKLLILDEPTAGVDIDSQQSFYHLLKQLNKEGIAIVLVTHEVGIISSFVKKVICINHSVCCFGKPKDIPELLEKMYGHSFVLHHHNNNVGHSHGGHSHGGRRHSSHRRGSHDGGGDSSVRQSHVAHSSVKKKRVAKKVLSKKKSRVKKARGKK